MKIRPNAKPIPPFGAEKATDAKKNPEEKQKNALGQQNDMAKTAADFTKSKTSRLGKLIGGKARGGPDLNGLMSHVMKGASAAVRQDLAVIGSRVDRFQNIMQRHSELGYLTRLGGPENDEKDDEIKNAGLALQKLNAGAGGGSPALSQMMERVSDLNQESPGADWAAKFKGARDLIDQAGKELGDLSGQLVVELQKAAAGHAQADSAPPGMQLAPSQVKVILNV